MEWKIAGSVIVALVAACAVLYAMHLKDREENAALKTALAQQTALLQETQAELALRDEVIKQRDAQLADLDKRREKAEGRYAQLIRTSKVVRDWDVVLLPDDVCGLLKAGASGADRAAGNADGGSGNP